MQDGVGRPKIYKQPLTDRRAQEIVNDRLSLQPTITFLNYAIITILVGTACFLIVIFGFMPEHVAQTYGLMVMSLVALIGAWLLRTKRYQAAIIWMAGGVWASITGTALFHQGVLAPRYFAYPLVVFFLGWVVSARAALVTVALTSATTVAFIVADTRGWLPAPPILHGIVQIFVLLLAAALVIYLVQAYRQRLEEMQRVSQEMERSNAVL
jgi:hypothetical protein